MPRRRKHAQYNATGCKVCGRRDVGRGLLKHLEGAHSVDHDQYVKVLYPANAIITDALVRSGSQKGRTKEIVLHVLVRRFVV